MIVKRLKKFTFISFIVLRELVRNTSTTWLPEIIVPEKQTKKLGNQQKAEKISWIWFYFSGNIISGLTHYLIKKLGCISKHLPWLSGIAVVYHVRTVDLFSLPPQYFFWKKYKSKPVRNLLQTSLQRNFCLTSPKFFAIFSSKLIKDINEISAWVTWADMELRSYLPRVPFLPAGPTGPLGKKRTLGR